MSWRIYKAKEAFKRTSFFEEKIQYIGLYTEKYEKKLQGEAFLKIITIFYNKVKKGDKQI